jgi:CheY-like chemotaxis protein
MGGKILVESTEGQGSSFTFRLALPSATAQRKPLVVADEPSAITCKVLLAEDNEVNRMVAKAQLARLGCEVVEARDGVEAIELFGTNQIDLVLLDIQMPGLDGYMTASRIRGLSESRGQYVPIIALSANALPEHRSESQVRGMDAHLTKPVRLSDLREAITRWTTVRPAQLAA